ncbi:MAG TPA: glycosyltransferase family 25 protein [Magnetospirillum sp.]|nr:glycosyltransferase family 25 protein [Magnetospirillum sp.]
MDARKIHVINLPRRPDRREEFLRRNAGKAEFVFVDAVDGSQLDRASLVEDGVLAADAHHVTDGALGCALSHREVWLACLEAYEPVIVCEDDAVLAPDFLRLADEAMASAPECEVVLFGYNLDEPVSLYLADGLLGMMRVADQITADPLWLDRYGSVPGAAPSRTTVVRPAVVWGLLCYALTPLGAARLLSRCFPLRNHDLQFPPGLVSRGIDGSVLALMQDGEVKLGCCLPPIAIGPNSDSDTEAGNKRA